MQESLFDMLERMESMVPDYGYATIERMTQTDRKIREFMLEEMRGVKDSMFHVVQVSYELQRDRLSDAAEDVWDEVSSLMTRVQSTRICQLKDKKACEACRDKVEENLYDIIRKDRQLVLAVLELKRNAGILYRALLNKGREKYFIKNLDRIKNCIEQVNSLLEERDATIRGA